MRIHSDKKSTIKQGRNAFDADVINSINAGIAVILSYVWTHANAEVWTDTNIQVAAWIWRCFYLFIHYYFYADFVLFVSFTIYILPFSIFSLFIKSNAKQIVC